MKKTSWLRRIFILVLTLCLCLSTQIAPVAYAAEDNTELMTIEEAGFTREEAMSMLNLTEEEAKNVDFYVLKLDEQEVLYSGDIYEPPTFTFTGKNIGRYFTVQATMLKAAVVWSPINAGVEPIEFRAYLWGYGETLFTDTMWTCTSNPEIAPNKWWVVMDWVSVKKGLDYHFIYYCDDINDGSDAKCEVTLIVGVA